MSGPKRTPWFGSATPPARAGVYQTRVESHPGLGGYSYWDGEVWSTTKHTPRLAHRDRHSRGFPDKRWRGLAAPTN